jgi:WD40 repeat protein
MLSIRSDFLDVCTSYRLLTDQINKSKYLLPQMSREALSLAITEPIHQSGASVASGFETYLLDELDDLNPRLPFLQFALHHTWNHWVAREQPDQPVSLEDFQSIGSVYDSWGRQLEEAYDKLGYRQKLISERMFKSIAFRTDHGEYISWQSSIDSIARIAQCSVEEAIAVAEIFRNTGGPILGPHGPARLTPESTVELSHECLITLWDRLQQWVDEEAESILMYLKLSEAAFKYQQGKVELWKPPELQKAIAWRDLQEPNPAWGAQFDPAFERTLVFLSTSEEEYAFNEEKKVILLRRRRLMIRSIAIVSGIAAVVVLLVFLLSKSQPEALDQWDNQTATNQWENNRAVPAQPSGERSQQQPIEQEDMNIQTGPGGVADAGPEEEPLVEQEEVGDDASEQDIDDQAPAETPQEDADASNGQENVRDNSVSPPGNIENATSARAVELNIVRDVAEQSTSISRDPDLQGLLAYQAYKLNLAYGGDPYDPGIYNGLYEARKKLISAAYNIYINLRHSVKAMVWLDRTGSILTASSDGSIKILSGNLANRSSQIPLGSTGLNNECLGVSPDERIAAVGTNGGGIVFIELENKGEVIQQSMDQGEVVLFIENLGNSGTFISAGTSNRILKWNYSDFTSSTLVTSPDRPTALTTSADGSKAMFGTRNGKLYLVNVGTASQLSEVNNFGGNPLRALALSPGERYLATGHLDGSVRIMTGDGRTELVRLYGPGARVSALEFSPNGRFLVAASHDGNVYLWNIQNINTPPLVFTENNGFVLSLCFSQNSSFFYSGSVSYPRMVGRPTEPDQMARDFCSLLGRNLSREEWNQYFGQDIPYEETCPE